jgi:hypothetical protein
MGWWHFLLNVTGSSNESSNWYAFWSGFAGDIPIVGGVFVLARHHNCAQPGCWRLGHAHRNHRCRRHDVKE